MTVPTSKTNDTPVRRGKARADTRCPACGVSRETAPDQIRDGLRIGDRWNAVSCGLNMRLVYRVGGDLLFKIADGDVERTAGEQIRGGIVIARLGKLPVCGSAGEICKAEASSKHDKGEDNDQRSAFRCAVARMKELFHGVRIYGDR